jgi:hypothetical protein
MSQLAVLEAIVSIDESVSEHSPGLVDPKVHTSQYISAGTPKKSKLSRVVKSIGSLYIKLVE